MATIGILDILNIPAILAIGVITSYEDIKYHKIRNKHVIWALGFSILSLTIAAAYTILSGEAINTGYISLYAKNLVMSLAFGFILWNSGLWSAGDAKLFLAYSALIPLSVYTWGDIGFPAYNIMINTFLPLFVYFLALIIIRSNISSLIEEARRTLHPISLLNIILFVFGTSWVVSRMLELAGIPQNIVTGFISMLFIFLISRSLFGDRTIYLAGTLSALRLITDVRDLDFIYPLMAWLLAFIAMNILIGLSNSAFSKRIYIEDLVPGMHLAEDVIEKEGVLINVRQARGLLRTPRASEGKSIFENPARLTEKDVKRIKSLHSGGKYPNHMMAVKEEVPFAALQFAGVLITLAFKGNALVSLIQLLS